MLKNRVGIKGKVISLKIWHIPLHDLLWLFSISFFHFRLKLGYMYIPPRNYILKMCQMSIHTHSYGLCWEIHILSMHKMHSFHIHTSIESLYDPCMFLALSSNSQGTEIFQAASSSGWKCTGNIKLSVAASHHHSLIFLSCCTCCVTVQSSW